MWIRLAGERDAELVCVCPVELPARSRFARLREEHLLRRTILRTPAVHAALKGAQPADWHHVGALREEVLEQGLRFDLRRCLQPAHHLRPDRRERVLVCPPMPRRPCCARPVAAAQVTARRLAIHACFERGVREHAAGVKRLHQ